MYPIEVFFGGISEKQEDFPTEAGIAAATENHAAQGAIAPENGDVLQEIFTSMKQYLKEAERCLLDIFYCGINSLWDEALSGLTSLSEDGERIGLHQAGICFAEIAELLQGKRHQMEFEPGAVLEVMETLLGYIRACQEKLSYDMALAGMKCM